jgi:hypothetical protein
MKKITPFLYYNPTQPPLITPPSPSYFKRGKMDRGVRLGGVEGLKKRVRRDVDIQPF